MSHILILVPVHVFRLPVELKNRSVIKKKTTQVLTTSEAEMTQFNSYKSLDNNIYHQYISLELTVQKIFVTDELHHLNPITPPTYRWGA